MTAGRPRLRRREVQRPQKTLPQALLIGTATVVVLYLGANLVYLHLIPIQEMKHASSWRGRRPAAGRSRAWWESPR